MEDTAMFIQRAAEDNKNQDVILDICALKAGEAARIIQNVTLLINTKQWAQAREELDPLRSKVGRMIESANNIPIRRASRELTALLTMNEVLTMLSSTIDFMQKAHA
jgi:hypothetical protein